MNARPFAKWVGGKTRLLPELHARLPYRFNAYHEPFVGGGALYWSLATASIKNGPSRRYHLSDMNPYLVPTYRAIKSDVEGLIKLLSVMPYEKGFFLTQRARDLHGLSDVEIGAWFIYLNRTCFNGLFRVNKSGKFNVPFGRYTNPTICDADLLRACSTVMTRTGTFVEQVGFEAVMTRAEPGDLVYFDPPYLPLSETSDFTAYTNTGFNFDDQVRLRDVALRLKQKGVYVMLSNSDAPRIRELYSEFQIDSVMAARAINSKADGRGKISELIIR